MLPVPAEQALAPQLVTFIAGGYLFKLLAALADTLPFILLVAWLRPWLGVPARGEEII